MPLVNKVPGLQQFDAARFLSAGDDGESSYYRAAELTFADQDALQGAWAVALRYVVLDGALDREDRSSR